MKTYAFVQSILLLGASGIFASCTPSSLATKGDAPAPDPLMGDWAGNRVTERGLVIPFAVRAVALGGGNYRFNVQPAFDVRDDANTIYHDGKLDGNRILLPEEPLWHITLENGEITGDTPIPTQEHFTLRRTVRLSPNLGAKAPSGATVLFDGSSLAAWQPRDTSRRGMPVAWKILDGGIMEVTPGSGDIISKKPFKDFQLHVEFRTPFMPDAREQARGNSGVYLQGRYEIQVLDSYGLKGEDNDCGGIYKVAAPRVNMCAPPGQWQSYDATFHATRFDSQGNKIQDATVTVVHNGVVIHKDLVIPGPTGGAIPEDIHNPAGVMLQDHGNLVQFRNIWVLELKE